MEVALPYVPVALVNCIKLVTLVPGGRYGVIVPLFHIVITMSSLDPGGALFGTNVP